ncbi:hypothetical protein HND97_17240 [Vibrio cholerae]|nr:hypothetical protein HND97_17240 [Vibrio cholerae]
MRDAFAIPSETTVATQSQPKIWGASLLEQLLAGKGDALPVTAYPADGIWPTNTSQLENVMLFNSRRFGKPIFALNAVTASRFARIRRFVPAL